MKKSKTKTLNFTRFKIAKLNYASIVKGGTNSTNCTTSEKCTRDCPTVRCTTIDPENCETDGNANPSSFICTN